MLSISNIYGHGFDEAGLAAFEALGFRRRPTPSTYMGAQDCYFIDFAQGPALELIVVTDDAAYRDFVPPGMVPYCPGISIVVPDGSPAALADYEAAFRALDPYRLHVPYRDDTGPAAPGWHYLNFAAPLVPDTFIWLTAFDAPRPAPARQTTHPNGVQGVVGLVFDGPPGDLSALARLAGVPCDGPLTLGGVAVWPRAALADVPPSTGKAFPLSLLVLRAPDLGAFADRAHARPASFEGRPAVLIELNPLCWDLLITA